MKVLIVEDTKTITNLLQVYLMGWNLEFFDAVNGAQGLNRARELRPDLIISDVQMPEMDGFALCAAVRADPLGVARWMAIGLIQAALFGLVAGVKWLIQAPDRAWALDRAARGLGKTLWWGPFKIGFYGRNA